MTGQHEGIGEQRLARLRACLKSRGLRRGLLIAGFATVAWLAGSSGANADSGPVADSEDLTTPVLSHALESASVPEKPGTDGLARSLDSRPAASTVDTAASETPNRVLRFTQPVTAPLAKQAAPVVLAPLKTAARPVTGELDAVTKPVDGTLKRIARPVAVDANPIGAMLPWAQPTGDETEIEPVRDQGIAAAKTRHGHADANESLDRTGPHFRTADGRAAGTEPFTHTAKPGIYGIAAAGGTGTGNGPGGSPTHDTGAGLSMSAADARGGNAGTSRVNPLTAATGQLPDHVEDPAVSPD